LLWRAALVGWAALDGALPGGTATDNPMNLDRGDTIQSTRKFAPFTVIDGGRKD